MAYDVTVPVTTVRGEVINSLSSGTSPLHPYSLLLTMSIPRTSGITHALKGHLRSLRAQPACLPRAIHSTAGLASAHKDYPFSFLPSNSLDPKAERTKGLTEIRGPYYAPVTKTYLDELLGDWGEYVDGVKFAGGSFSLMPEDRVRALIDTAHKHGERDRNQH